MKVYIGADHRGYQLKEELKKILQNDGESVVDVGNQVLDPDDDYVDFAKLVAEEVSKDSNTKGILLCGSGVGVDMAANKVSGVRAALCQSIEGSRLSRQHEDANVVCLPADDLDVEKSHEIVRTFLDTSFQTESRHIRRIQKLKELDRAF